MSFEAPLTPKVCNGLHSKREHDDCSNLLQRSMKRMKVTSASAGELRLQRDFKHAVCCAGWVPVGSCCNGWKVPPGDASGSDDIASWYTLKQSIEDPLHLLAYSSKWKMWIDIPRLYPHRPPILKVTHSRNQLPTEIVFQAAPEDPQVDEALNRGALVLRGWSPLLRLHEILSRLVVPLLNRGPSAIESMRRSMVFDRVTISSSCDDMIMDDDRTQRTSHVRTRRHAEADRATEILDTSRLLIPEQDDDTVCMKDSEHHTVFAPNRFDLGYRRDMKSILTDSMVLTHE